MEKSKIRLKTFWYWLGQVEFAIEIYLASILGFSAYELLFATNGDAMKELNLTFTFCFFFIGMILSITMFSFGIENMFQTALNFGSTRREAFWGQQIYFVLLVIQMCAIYLLVTLLTRDSFVRGIGYVLVFLVMALATSGIIQIVSGLAANLDKKKKVIVKTIIFFVVFILEFAFFIITQIMEIPFIDSVGSGKLIAVLLPAALVIYVLGSCLGRKELNGLEVQV